MFISYIIQFLFIFIKSDGITVYMWLQGNQTVGKYYNNSVCVGIILSYVQQCNFQFHGNNYNNKRGKCIRQQCRWDSLWYKFIILSNNLCYQNVCTHTLVHWIKKTTRKPDEKWIMYSVVIYLQVWLTFDEFVFASNL